MHNVSSYDGAIGRVIDAFSKLPGIGPKGAQRIAFYILSSSDVQTQDLIDAISDLRENVRFCEICGNVCEQSPCVICQDPRRDHTKICVVEEPKDIMSIERTHEYAGVYHVLGGAINPMANIGPADLKITQLLERLKDAQVKEVILALDPNIEGEATVTYLARLLEPLDISITRLASGLPVGGDLEYADEITLGRAFAGRQEV
ncbi:recombination protein RecR [Gardnerella sp. DNF00354]|uniref:Recombination protein RecR n=1 Tax=Gardnerella vaginalis TaxID=2702 RepID=A0A0J8F863_GARVA|nr:recombination mediator RecR [Gardnerella vaginalis]CQB85105.1 recombination protein RecR [Chlamydia trachomatis]AEF31185.1 recombination protein RecR [Gardnerella vaginalis HMP9231]AYZ21177.1 recombination protein RecR [Gardnerella vaginalis]EGL14852.1 recombination protein RecR [Gardnerella vaginalis 315-A]EIK74458.1 recombination protein RecR [Gardnerella vaginalis 75712]